ncbi:Acetyltransferase EpsM [Macrococcoides canis]|uniref:Acetyltransferase EpsM n=1 Tax=Macrococcoides canis TaxID=1855823 RepID=A0A1W7AA79_9STAP|nr:acetyltransferase [Macrococcus canis]ARQ06545.1 Putative acetyltransferase EpsM [Macrococcus canis]
MHKITLLGNGGHAKVIRDMIERHPEFDLYAILDGQIHEKFIEEDIIYDSMDCIEQYKHTRFIIAIGNNHVREKIVNQYSLVDSDFATIIDPSSVVSKFAHVSIGTVVMPNSVINSHALVGKHSIINSGAIIEHDNVLGDFIHISPGAVLSGTVTVGDYTHVGSGSVVIPNINIGARCIIGAGSVIIKDIERNVTVVGNPARIIKRSE